MLKDWRGAALREGDQVLWATHSGHRWSPRLGVITKVDEVNRTVTAKRELTDYEKRWGGRGTSTLPPSHVTRVDALPLPEDEKGLTAL